jgi:hypothetical protein
MMMIVIIFEMVYLRIMVVCNDGFRMKMGCGDGENWWEDDEVEG